MRIPIKNAILGDPFFLHGSSEQLKQILIVGSFFEFKFLGVVEHIDKVPGVALPQKLGRCLYLFVHDHLVLRFAILGLHVLPGQHSPQQVEDDIADRLNVIPS